MGVSAGCINFYFFHSSREDENGQDLPHTKTCMTSLVPDTYDSVRILHMGDCAG